MLSVVVLLSLLSLVFYHDHAFVQSIKRALKQVYSLCDFFDFFFALLQIQRTLLKFCLALVDLLFCVLCTVQGLKKRCYNRQQ